MVDFNLSADDYKAYLIRCEAESKEKCQSEDAAFRLYWGHETEKCYVSFEYFCRHYVKVSKPAIPGISKGGVVPLEMWPHILDAIHHLQKDRLIVVLKSRQIGWTTIVAAFIAWCIIFHPETRVSVTSKGLEEAKEVIGKTRTVIDYLPWSLVPRMEPTSTEAIGFPDMRTDVRAFPSTASAGKAYTPSVIFYDEHAEHEYAALNFNAAKPGIDTIGGKLISVFTAPDVIDGNYAVQLFLDALAGKNGFVPLFYPWDVVPGRDQKWLEQKIRETPKDKLGTLTPELYRMRNYPSSIEEALSTPDTVMAFNKDTIEEMEVNCRAPGHVDGVSSDIINIYKPFMVGRSYVVASDVALGVGGDYNVTVVVDCRSLEVVADIFSNTLTPEELTFHSVKLLGHYRNPVWWPEHNLYGRTVIRKALELGYRNIGKRGKEPINFFNPSDADVKRLGFYTEGSSRADLFGTLMGAINNKQVTIYNRAGLEQFKHLYRNPKRGVIEATPGNHDDYPIAVGIALLKAPEIIPYSSGPAVISTLSFPGRR